MKLLIDTDPGVDDALTILMALASPGIDVVGLTTVGGNVPLARGTRNALALLEYAGRPDIPVARGAARPLRGRFLHSPSFHGPGGLSRRLPEPRAGAIRAGAVDFLAAMLAGRPGRVTLVALGPLTNLAHLLRRSPGALRRAASLIIMGGAVGVEGNVTPRAEFNFHNDPVAAHEVVSSGIAVSLVDLGAARQAFVTRDEAAGLRAGSNVGALAVQLLNNWFRRDPLRERFECYDPLAFAVAVDPEIATFRRTALEVETSDPARLGETSAAAGDGPVALAREVDRRRFFGLLQEALGLRYLGEPLPRE